MTDITEFDDEICSFKNGSRFSLLDILSDAELSSYHQAITTKLKVHHVEHFKFVTDDDLNELGMSKPEQRRLWKTFRRYFPASIVGRLKKKVFGSNTSCNSTETNQRRSFKSNNSISIEKHIIPVSAITLCKQLGQGEFGLVWQGVWSNGEKRTQVAVKCVASEKLLANPFNFLQEAAVMHRISHPHIVRLFGVVLDTKSIMLVSELAPLRSLFECLKDGALRTSFPVDRLCDYVEQIVEGMCYLEEQRLIHRDLAARNILVFSAEKVKISDFGLSRSLDSGEDYYRSELTDSLKLPIAWCAPEAINFLKFTSASDVWAFGVTVWEMFSYGLAPWTGMTGAQILSSVDCPHSLRLDPSEACPFDYYHLLLQCWQHDPNARPKFVDIRSILFEIRPQQLKTIDECNDVQVDHLQYHKDQLITVLNRRPSEYPDGYFWRGALKSGKIGLFLPSNTIAHLDAEYPTSNMVSFNHCDAIASLSIVKSASKKKKKDRHQRPAISEPHSDVRHIFHYGSDGLSFDDDSHPQFASPCVEKLGCQSEFERPSRYREENSSRDSNKPRAPSPFDLDSPVLEKTDSTGQMSLLDEVFEALQTDTLAYNYSDTARLLDNYSSARSPTTPSAGYSQIRPRRPEPLVRPMSHTEAKQWTALSERAHRRADKNLSISREQQQSAMISLGNIEPPESMPSTSIRHRVKSSLKVFDRSNSSHDIHQEGTNSTTFTDSLMTNRDTLTCDWTPEAQDAYKLLIQCGIGLQSDPIERQNVDQSATKVETCNQSATSDAISDQSALKHANSDALSSAPLDLAPSRQLFDIADNVGSPLRRLTSDRALSFRPKTKTTNKTAPPPRVPPKPVNFPIRLDYSKLGQYASDANN